MKHTMFTLSEQIAYDRAICGKKNNVKNQQESCDDTTWVHKRNNVSRQIENMRQLWISMTIIQETTQRTRQAENQSSET